MSGKLIFDNDFLLHHYITHDNTTTYARSTFLDVII